MLTEYNSIDGLSVQSIKIKKSEFIAQAIHVKNAESAEKFILDTKKAHKTARHNVYAYLLKDEKRKCSDDGEPTATAGKPILEIIKKQGLKDICVVVTRYFGGILLGYSGLLRAYSSATIKALEKSKRVKYVFFEKSKVKVDYSNLKYLEMLIYKNKGKIIDKQYNENAEITFILSPDKTQLFESSLKNKNINLEMKSLEKDYYKT